MRTTRLVSVFVGLCVCAVSSSAWYDRLSDAFNAEELDEDDQPMFGQEEVVVGVVGNPDYQDAYSQVYRPDPGQVDTIAVDDGTVAALGQKVDRLLSEIKSQRQKIEELDTTNKKLLNKIDLIEQQAKVNNLIFTNVHESRYENNKATVQKVLYIINRIMKVRTSSADIAVALRVDSRPTGLNQSRPIVVTFTNFSAKMKVLGAKNKLKKSLINVTSDYSELVSQRRKELLPFLIEKRRLGHIVFMVYDKLVVDGERVSLEELQTEKRQATAGGGGKEQEEEVTSEPPDTETDEEPDEQVEEIEVDPLFQESDYDE